MSSDLDFVAGPIVIGVIDHPSGEPEDSALNRFHRREVDVVRRCTDRSFPHGPSLA